MSIGLNELSHYDKMVSLILLLCLTFKLFHSSKEYNDSSFRIKVSGNFTDISFS